VPTPAQAQEIANLGAFGLFVFVVIFVGAGLYRRWWVPGWVWEQDRAARIVAETQAERTVVALEANSRALAEAVREVAALRREMRAHRDEFRRQFPEVRRA
jgi:hypothetical protein